MNRHKEALDKWIASTEEEKYAEWSKAVLSLGIGLDYVSWTQLHEAELSVAAGIESDLNLNV